MLKILAKIGNGGIVKDYFLSLALAPECQRSDFRQEPRQRCCNIFERGGLIVCEIAQDGWQVGAGRLEDPLACKSGDRSCPWAEWLEVVESRLKIPPAIEKKSRSDALERVGNLARQPLHRHDISARSLLK